MAATKFVSAQWQAGMFPGQLGVIKAIGDDDQEYFVPSWNTDVPPWPDFIINGGHIDPVEETPEPEPETPPEEPEAA